MRENGMTGFRTIAEGLTEAEGGYRFDIPDNWRQGRTAYGGLTAGLSLAAVQREFNDLPPLRSLMINFIGPITDNPVFKSRLLRQGRNVTSIETQALIGEDVVATTTFIFGATRESDLAVQFPAPEAALPEACELFTPELAKPFVPVFFHNFDTRIIAGKRPMSGAEEGYIRTWSRHVDEASREGIDSLVAIGDVLPPAALPMFTKMGPVSSVNWMFNVLVDEPVTTDGWWHIETKLTAASGGYASQVMRYWNTDGVLVAEGMQAVAIFV
jgi:acyl-CoA thioesterase